MSKIVVGNLKMSMATSEISDYLKQMKQLKYDHVIICPTNIYVPYFLKQKYKVGLQNIYEEELGSFTGEVCPKQAATMGIKYTLIGHSDRRLLFHETDEVINKKLAVMDMTASVMCMEHKMPLVVFGLNEKESIVNTYNGNFNGTRVTV